MASSGENIAGKLKGNTLRTYVALLGSDKGVVGVRELQRKLGFSSPALASYHLRRLEELGLVVEDKGNYRLLKEVKVGILAQFIRLGTIMLPRYVFYATFFSTLLVYYLSQLKELHFYSVFGLLFGVLGTAVFWFEALRIWRQKP